MKIIMAAFAVALFAFVSTAADARPRHHHKHYAHHRVVHHAKAHHVRVASLPARQVCVMNNDGRTICSGAVERSSSEQIVRLRGKATKQPVSEITRSAANDPLVNEARKYIGTNPTGRGSLWCGAFMDLVLKRTGHQGGGNLASNYAHYGTRVAGPQIGAIAVMSRSGGGHVGVVSGVDANGNPIIISGNTRMGKGPHTTLEHAYPRERIYAYVVPR